MEAAKHIVGQGMGQDEEMDGSCSFFASKKYMFPMQTTPLSRQVEWLRVQSNMGHGTHGYLDN